MAREVTTTIEDYIARGIFPGASFVVLDGADSSEEQVFGTLDGVQSVQPGMLWDLASVSKVVGTGTAVIQKLLTGEIGLDDQLSAHLQDWRGPDVSIRELLTHHSGLDPFIPARDKLDRTELTAAMMALKASDSKDFRYTDVNFILLGLMLENIEKRPLDAILQAEVFKPFGLTETSFGPVRDAVPSVRDLSAGIVHDPKARVLGNHCGSAGLFSTAQDLTAFVRNYFERFDADFLTQNYAPEGSTKARSLAWDLLADNWLLHTGYTGCFILMNLTAQKAFIFLSNRTFYKDERAQWILDRDKLISQILSDV